VCVLRPPVVTKGSLLRFCVEVRAAIELSLREVSEVSLGIHVVDGVHVSKGDFGVYYSASRGKKIPSF